MKSLDDVFNVDSGKCITSEVITKEGDVVIPQQSDDEQKIEYDYEKTRNNLHTLLSHGQDALMYALEVAKQSEHPRAFEVVGELVSKLATVNEQLLGLSEKHQKLLNTKKEEVQSNNITNNAIFVGSTNELNKMIKSMVKGE